MDKTENLLLINKLMRLRKPDDRFRDNVIYNQAVLDCVDIIMEENK